METENLHILTEPKIGVNWLSQEYISSSVTKYLKNNGYKVNKPDIAENGSISLVASKFFKKELIEVKGYPSAFLAQSAIHGGSKNSGALQHAKQWFSDALFNSLSNFGSYYAGENVMLAIALPNVDRYKAIIARLQEYFTLNQLSFKIYLVDENGDVEVSNLNDTI